jgi:hypothetical protein
MRKLRIRQIATAISIVLLYGGCSKEAAFSSETMVSDDFSLQYTPSVQTIILGKNKAILPFNEQNSLGFLFQITDCQFFTTKTFKGRMEGDSLENTPYFSIFFFNEIGQEQTENLDRDNLTQRLRQVGMPPKTAEERVEKIFGSANCSPTYLVETADRIAATLPTHEEGLYAAEVRKPTIAATLSTQVLNRRYAAVHWVYGMGQLPQSEVKRVHLTLGVAGSLMARGDSKVEIWLKNGSYRQYDPQLVRTILKEKHGDTEGDKLFAQLILGELTEQAVWSLFKQEIVPNVYQDDKNGQLQRLFFRYNYVLLNNGTGRVGYTIYDMDGTETAVPTL